MKKTLMVMAGGTGGHVYPAMAVADHLMDKGWQIVWLCTEGGMENRLIENKAYAKSMIKMKGVRGKGLIGWIHLPVNLFKACKQAYKAIGEYKPNLILGMGGFAAFPGGLMAMLKKTPLVIHEQNSVAGLTNQCLAKLANKTLAAFPSAFGNQATLIGNPVRHEIVQVMHPSDRFEQRKGPLRVLVVGGSLGAQALNETLPKAFAAFSQPLEIIHQAGVKHIDGLNAAYENAQVTASTMAFIEEIASMYEWADIVICRAGALTIAELSAAGVASILVPFPFAVDDHQTGNARYLADAEAAILVQQTAFTVEKVVELLGTITREKCKTMAMKARLLGKPNATAEVARVCEVYAL
jgi:UDP-N-acetylglucosamine--N-acetylmuramyl-(pentapeptide) pyrophosphoryl-undecaprenol N-acetylglucosamine transferase